MVPRLTHDLTCAILLTMHKFEHKDHMSKALLKLGSRARQALEAIYRLGEASAHDLLNEVDDIPSYSAARSVLRQLLQKGLVERREEDFKYVYSPAISRQRFSKSALVHLLNTFFDGSPEKTMEALLDLSRTGELDIDLDRYEKLIQDAKKEGR